ncbi:cobaltochelatase CobT-related protein [Cupriavidus pinatubonensis]|uniref:Aerobic cobaltochelatase subunit CobT n=1 Tax=Cupriavidus pinatubonensis TaxID=248026 RepID=A0ABM8WZB7_9BURK|nr:cobalt chelatase [Cupriavidus pinatubonensis]CAG9172937.1 Aerobic cobaltochelatase subunit CobT [Cupriavidus pinatubonensis]
MSAAAAAQRLRRRQRQDALSGAAVRALTGDAALHFRDGRLWREMRPVPQHAPHLRTDPDTDSAACLRGAADGAALRHAHSDATLHRSLCPEDAVERLLFEMLEQLRCETRVPRGMAGVEANLRHRFLAWSRAFHRSGLTEGQLGILLYTVAQIAWSRLSGEPVLDETEDLIEATRAAIVPVLGTSLGGLRAHRHDQPAFAEHALALARAVAQMVHSEAPNAGEDDGDAASAARAGFALWLDFEEEQPETFALADSGHSRVLAEAKDGYRVFTTRYDREVRAATLVRRALLDEYRTQLDARIARAGVNVARLARRLRAALALPRVDGWSFGEESGRIDGRRLAQLVSSPAERRLFRQEAHRAHADCVVGFLVDCSGSMKARAEPLTLLLDLLTRALDEAGVATEVLGFTTGAWNGGRARADWLARGRPAHPGRLNETCHMVFKDATRSWRRSRTDITALLKPDLFREGIDGEAVEWACARLHATGKARRILLVVSDGSPMDTATGQANDASYLDNHLKAVVARHESLRDVEVLGLGVGLDLSPYYRHALAVDLSQPVDMAMLDEVADLLAARRR